MAWYFQPYHRHEAKYHAHRQGGITFQQLENLRRSTGDIEWPCLGGPGHQKVLMDCGFAWWPASTPQVMGGTVGC
ncbi:MAG: hypothetical protein C7B44_08825 [Sulfobacillus thermosulfidooxidans]|nr:MAG: hypothetical protein C7B44_08825 [Sulfobacillus thermosulfidooxidans]